ncbi:Gfo/Idh/MocA family protein [Actinoallomurus rhizosphaericola]|uniref:Gfo/Idh/MocA family protein n=1 Tax=Actinoallomurus rhizosphaericola TaxID=2952536 RepID=UPI00209396C1|nr:Gfo/Idh/MocA family oxidoreductase [Actinoallomurus rhizosphaericola]MCO5995417.1 Gfo/Idh/MocA family oxidoreductase [Actinoallomurus rhizosphaericola]
MRSVVRVGVLGCASIALRRVLPAMKEAEGVVLTAVASRDPARAREVAERFGCGVAGGYDELLDRPDIDAVYLPLPTGLHAHWASRALAAGKHVLSEKPLTCDHATALDLVNQAEKAGLWLMENFMFLHHGQHRKVRDLVADGRIGEPRVFTASFGIPPLDPADVRYDPELGGGALLDVGVYPIRAASYFLGPDLDVVGSVLRLHPSRGVDVAGHVLLCAPSGVTAELSFGFEHAYRCRYALWGDRARLTLDRAFTPPPTLEPRIRIQSQDGIEELTLPADHQFKNILEFFARSILQGADHTAQAEAIIRQARLVDQVRSAAVRVTA